VARPFKLASEAAEGSPMFAARGAAPAHREGGFTLVEVMVAVTVLAIILVLTIQPVMTAMRRIDTARWVSVAESLAQSEIESIRGLSYQDVGVSGFTPSGVLSSSKTMVVDGRSYTVATDVTYQGSITGLHVIPQGGDGVQGSWDAGVDYKAVTVTVSGAGLGSDPVVVNTIVAPPNIGAHEGIANARVTVAAYEPFAAGTFVLPEMQVQASPAAAIRSRSHDSAQVFPGIPPGNYVAGMAVADGWVLHPADVTAGRANLNVVVGQITETALRVYKPARLLVTVTDLNTGLALGTARVSLTNVPSGTTTNYTQGQYTITGLIPDAYNITVAATGYESYSATSVNIPAGYPSPDHSLAVALRPIINPPVTVTFTVKDNTGRAVNGATMTVTGTSQGTLTAVTDSAGVARIDIVGGATVTATATTPWGHGPRSASFDPAVQNSVALNLTRPSGYGTMGMLGGTRASHFGYRIPSGTWVFLPVNASGEGSFVAVGGSYEVRKRCTNGTLLSITTVSVASGSNRTTTPSGTCP
jgi:prepilin-type N-terminal cleavage/methylation domain-containing protein